MLASPVASQRKNILYNYIYYIYLKESAVDKTTSPSRKERVGDLELPVTKPHAQCTEECDVRQPVILRLQGRKGESSVINVVDVVKSM